jgi:hypothetical protein
MNAAELARMLDSWSDALNVAEVVESPFLRLTDQWDLSDWQAIDSADGLEFQRLGQRGAVTEAVMVVPGNKSERFSVPATVPTWLVRVRIEVA